MERNKRIATSVEEEKKIEVRMAAAERDMDMAEWVREAIDEKLARRAEEEGNPMPSEQPAD